MRVKGILALVLLAGLLAVIPWACGPPPGGTSGDNTVSPGRGGREPFAEEVRFRGGGNVLAGTLYRPAGRGPHPAVVFVLGSGRADRAYGGVAPALGRHLARHGFACLAWDKPGVGQSTGDYQAQTVHDRAAEALAAVEYLRGRADIAPDRVGLWGHSQGGAVAPLAASLSARVAFLIEVAGWQGPAWQQDPVRVGAELRAAHFPEEDVTAAVAFAAKRMALIRGGGPFEELEKAQRVVRDRPWFTHVRWCDRKLFYSARRIVGYDTGPFWEGVRCPVLVIYGDRDTSSGPPGPLVAVIRRGLAKAGNRDVTVAVFHDADHSLRRAGGRARRRGNERGPDFVPGYLDTMTDWLARRFRPARGGRDDRALHPRGLRPDPRPPGRLLGQ